MKEKPNYAVFGRGQEPILIELITSKRRGRAIRRFKELLPVYGEGNIYLSTLTVDGRAEEEVKV